MASRKMGFWQYAIWIGAFFSALFLLFTKYSLNPTEAPAVHTKAGSFTDYAKKQILPKQKLDLQERDPPRQASPFSEDTLDAVPKKLQEGDPNRQASPISEDTIELVSKNLQERDQAYPRSEENIDAAPKNLHAAGASSNDCNEDRYWVGKYNAACNRYYLSIVLTVRNDNYGGSFQQRLRAMIQATLVGLNAAAKGSHMVSGNTFRAEIILVEYRPSSAQPLTKEIVSNYIGPYLSDNVAVRVITVPELAIKTWPDPKGLIVAEYLGKNIGIRRARGEFVLAANADDILSRALIKFIAKGALNYGAYYRAALLDPFFPDGGSAGWSELPTEEFISKTAGYTHDEHVCRVKPNACNKQLPSMEECKASFSCKVYAEEMEYNGDVCRAGGLHGQGRLEHHPSLSKFGNINNQAPGDFILMSRKDWFALGAHAEALAHRHHFDGWVECRALHVFKIAQINLNAPCVVLHQDHGGKKFRAQVVTAAGNQDTAAGHHIGIFGMKFSAPKATYRTIFSKPVELGNDDGVRESRALTKLWQDSFHRPGYKSRVLDMWDWNEHLNHMFGPGKKPRRDEYKKVCAATMKGGVGERLFDGRNYHGEEFGFPEWVFEEVVFER